MKFIYKNDIGEEIYHHGVEGQKWGVKHGPPYPLDRTTHNRVTGKNSGTKTKGEKKESSSSTTKERTYPVAIQNNYIPSHDYPSASKKAIDAIRNNGPIEEQLAEYENWYTTKDKGGTRIRDAADLGLAALDYRDELHFLAPGELVQKDEIDNNRIWFLYEDQTPGLALIADMINRGYSADDVSRLLDNVDEYERKMSDYDDIDFKYSSAFFELDEAVLNMEAGWYNRFPKDCETIRNKIIDTDNDKIKHSDNELYHYAIPGYKKGVRRFQYEDGSLTPEGKLRYQGGSSSSKFIYKPNTVDTKKFVETTNGVNRPHARQRNDSGKAVTVAKGETLADHVHATTASKTVNRPHARQRNNSGKTATVSKSQQTISQMQGRPVTEGHFITSKEELEEVRKRTKQKQAAALAAHRSNGRVSIN